MIVAKVRQNSGISKKSVLGILEFIQTSHHVKFVEAVGFAMQGGRYEVYFGFDYVFVRNHTIGK